MPSGGDIRENHAKIPMPVHVRSSTDKQNHARSCSKSGLKNIMNRHERTWHGTNRHEEKQQANKIIFVWKFASGSNTITNNAGELPICFSRSLDRILVETSQVQFCLTG